MKPPNLLLIVTDQQRRPMHWPEDPAWLEALTPADIEIARTGVSFTEASAASCMCSPSRASLLTGRWPAEHGVTLTLTQGGARIQPRNAPSAITAAAGAVLREELAPGEALKTLFRGSTRRPTAARMKASSTRKPRTWRRCSSAPVTGRCSRANGT